MKINFVVNRRIFIIMLVVVFSFTLLVFTLADLTLVNGIEYNEISQNRKRRTLSQVGTRGMIMDANGIPLAYDQKSYDVHFYKDPSKTSPDDRMYYTDILMRTVNIIEANNGKVIDTFAIRRNENNEYIFDFGITNPEAIAKREARWRSDMYVTSIEDVEDIYLNLRTRYQIPQELTYEQVRPLLSIWQELQLNASKAYLPVVISYNVNIQTVAEIETHSLELAGVEIAEGTTRIYPRKDTAAHIIGYLGKTNDEETLARNSELGYDPNALFGVSGIESSMELELTPNLMDRQGKKEVEVNNRGQIMRVFSTQDPKSGNSVMLTIDTKLQLKVERALEENINEIRTIQEEEYANKQEEYDELLLKANRKKLNLATSGAAIVMDVNTGKVLAMASYPSFDLNIFTGGIAEEDYKALNDPEIAPLLNKALTSKATPGSIFKMITAMGALMDGKINKTDTISDEGPYYINKDYKGKVPTCHIRPSFYKHAHQTIADGLKNSCNYFFYELANRMGIERVTYWASEFGLDKKTNIELPYEATGQIGGQLVLYDSTKPLNNQRSFIPGLVYRNIKELLRKIGEDREIEYSETEITNAADRIIKLPDGTTVEFVANIRQILSEEMSIPVAISSTKRWPLDIKDQLLELVWNPNRTILAGIGQEPILVTPIEIVRYVSAIANGGTVYNASIVDKIINPDGSVLKKVEPVVANKVNIPQDYWEIIGIGMSDVLSTEAGGTAGAYFRDFKYTDKMAAKTGTAQVSTIDLENNSWFVAYTPVANEQTGEKPEIAVVVYIPNGYKSGLATKAARDIIQYYLDEKENKIDIDIPTINSVVSR